MKCAILIPSRLDSSRLPQKALKKICGIPLIEHVYKRALLSQVADKVFVATDSPLIAEVIHNCNGNVLMTSSAHRNGTERIAEAAFNINAEYILNVQGDEALVDPNHIDLCLTGLQTDPESQAAILVNKYYKKDSTSDIKVVLDNHDRVMYFSRSDIPCFNRSSFDYFLKAYHVVAFKKHFLLKYPTLPASRPELVESNEYLRILSEGYNIKAIEVTSSAISVDTLDDYHHVCSVMPDDPVFQKYK